MNKNKRIWIAGFVLLLVGCIGLVYLLFDQPTNQESSETISDYHAIEYNGQKYNYNSSIVSILFMGIDSTVEGEMGQADFLMLCLLDRENEEIQILNISRDTMTDIRLYDVEGNDLGWQEQHLGLAYAYGSSNKNGASLTSQAVSRLLNDVPVIYFAAMDLSALKSVHDVVGELEVVVPNDSLVDIHPDWTTGSTIVLTSENVEDFVRTRDTDVAFSNNVRMQRQEAYMNAYLEKLKILLKNNFEDTFNKVYNVFKNLTTNIPLDDLQSFANMLLSYSYDSSNYYSLQGQDQQGANHDEFIVDEEALNKLVVDLFYEKED